MRTAVIGGGAAGFFLAVNLKEMMPQMEVTIFERGQRVLRKVEVSGGGRCNCTNTFRDVSDLSQVYPRGHRLLKRLFHQFDYRDAYQWFERHGVPLAVQDDECVFPRAQDSHAIIDCFLSLTRRYGVTIVTGHGIASLDDLASYDYVVVTTGGVSHTISGWLEALGHEIVEPVPSLFSFTVADDGLRALQGLVAEDCAVLLPGTKLRAGGPLLITHWGVSGPAILKLSSYAARHLADCGYRSPLTINWLSKSEADVRTLLSEASTRQPQKQLTTFNPLGLPQRLWALIIEAAIGEMSRDSAKKPQRPEASPTTVIRWGELGKKDMNRLVNALTNYTCQIEGRTPFKDEFVTCGGVSLSSVNPITLESRSVHRLYFAGEVLDIDGITGGFNFQAAWTTAYTVAAEIAKALSTTGL